MRPHSIFLTLLLAGSASLHAQSNALTTPAPKASALDGQLFYQLLLGEFSARADEPGTAFSLFLDAARKTNDATLYRRTVQIALQARSGESALQAARAWSQAQPASRDANRFVLQILLGLNRVADALEPLKRAIALTPASEMRDTLWAVPGYFERVTDRQLAASTVQKALSSVLSDNPLAATGWAVVARMWLGAEDKVQALNAASKGAVIDPRAEHPAWVALSLLGANVPAAEPLVKKHLPYARAQFRIAYVKTLLGIQREDDARAELQSINSNNPEQADAWLIQGALALQYQQPTLAQRHLQRYLDLTGSEADGAPRAEFQPGRSQAFLYLAQIARQSNDFQQADAWLQRVDNPDDVLRAQLQRAVLMAQQGNVDAALALIQNQPERSASDVRQKQSAEIQLLREHKLFDRARTALQDGLLRNPNDLDLVYELAMVNEKLGNLEEMERLLRSLMVSKPDDPQAYNALGYSLADRNLRLPEAQQLITKALQLAPNDPFIVDSLAWAEFRNGNRSQALQLLQGAFKRKPDAEIAAHLGEVLWTLNRHDEAVEIFKQGVKLNPSNETLTETLKRLRVPL